MLQIVSLIIGPIADILKRVIPDADARAAAQEEITKTIIANEAALNDAMKTVMAADSASESWLTRSARPLTVVWSLLMVTWLAVIAPFTGLQAEALNAVKAIPTELWNLISVGIGGYMLARTVEKALPTILNRNQK